MRCRRNRLMKCLLLACLYVFIYMNMVNKSYLPLAAERITSQPAQITKNTIFISMPSLGDYACGETVLSAFDRALHPENIYVGVYQQNKAEDPDCLRPIKEQCKGNNSHVICGYLDHVLINRTDLAHGAKGPVYARYMSMKLYTNQEYVMMVDSHVVFRRQWDSVTLTLLHGIPNEYSVLTHYPWGAEFLEVRTNEKLLKPSEMSYHICGSSFGAPPNYIPANGNGCMAKTNMTNLLTNHAIRVPFFGGGFSFTRAHFWKTVPLDPYLLYIFQGEEFDISTRGWTHGYDFYSPPFDIVGHYYKGRKRRTPYVDGKKKTLEFRDRSEKRLNYKWGLFKIRYPNLPIERVDTSQIDIYGLGNKRSLAEYWKFAGIDVLNKTGTVFSPDIYSKGGLQYVPWN